MPELSLAKINSLSVREDIGRAKYVEEKDVAEKYTEIESNCLVTEMAELIEEGGIEIA